MSLASLPNEVLLKILSHLPFEDLMLCATTCKRFSLMARSFFIDTLKPNDSLQLPIQHVATTSNSLFVVYETGAADFFEFFKGSTSLFRTASCQDQLFSDLFLLAIRPNTKTVVIHPKVSTFYVYDVKTSTHLCKTVVSSEILSLSCSEQFLVVQNGHIEILLYSFMSGCGLPRLVQSLASKIGRPPSLSSNGVLAYTDFANSISLFDLSSGTKGDCLVRLGGPPLAFQISPNGRLLLVKSFPQCTIIDVASKQSLFSYTCRGVLFCDVIFSDDCNYLAIFQELKITVLSFKPNFTPGSSLVLDFKMKLKMPENSLTNCAIFRNISGSCFLQFLNKTGTYELKEVAKRGKVADVFDKIRFW